MGPLIRRCWPLLLAACGGGPAPAGLDTDPAPQACNGIDDDGDGAIDEGLPASTWYLDEDGDGVGADASFISACAAPDGYTSALGDCDDAHATVSPEVADPARACGDFVEDCSGAPCRWQGHHELEAAASVTWTGGQVDEGTGARIAGVGDIDGDGRRDFAIAHRVFTKVEPGDHASDEGAHIEIVADWPNSGLGVRAAGDVDGDGREDLIVWSYASPPETDRPAGAWLIRAPQEGVIDVLAEGLSLGEPLQVSLALGVGDLDEDGYADVVLAHAWEGLAVYPGGAEGPAYTPSARILDPGYDLMDGNLGALAAVGDLDGDGTSDFALGAGHSDEAVSEAGAVCVFTHLPSGDTTLREATDVLLLGAEPMERAGTDVDGAGDVNGDGYDDLLVGNLTMSWGEADGYVTNLWVGSLVLGPVLHDGSLGDADARFFTDHSSDATLGVRARGLGDLDADGLDDFAFALEREGVVYVYYGGREGTQSVLDADAQYGQGTYYAVGSALDGVGDVDGDGFDDFIIGSSKYDESRGMAALIPGWAR